MAYQIDKKQKSEVVDSIKDLLINARENVQANEPYNDTAKRDVSALKFILNLLKENDIPEGCYECPANDVFILSPDGKASIECPILVDRRDMVDENDKPNWCPINEEENKVDCFRITTVEFYYEREDALIELKLGDRVEIWYKINNHTEYIRGIISNFSKTEITVKCEKDAHQGKIEPYQIEDINFIDIIKNKQ